MECEELKLLKEPRKCELNKGLNERVIKEMPMKDS